MGKLVVQSQIAGINCVAIGCSRQFFSFLYHCPQVSQVFVRHTPCGKLDGVDLQHPANVKGFGDLFGIGVGVERAGTRDDLYQTLHLKPGQRLLDRHAVDAQLLFYIVQVQTLPCSELAADDLIPQDLISCITDFLGVNTWSETAGFIRKYKLRRET